MTAYPPPVAILTYGYDFDPGPDTTWAYADDYGQASRAILRKIPDMPSYVGVYKRTDDSASWRLFACLQHATGWEEPMVADDDDLDIPDGAGLWLHTAADALGIQLAHAKPYWLMTAGFAR